MVLPSADVEIFFKLHRSLLFFVNQRLQVLPQVITTADDFFTLSPEHLITVRDAFKANPALLDAYVIENPARLSQDELDIVASWRHGIVGRFYVLRDLKNYTVFLSSDDSPLAYGVLALSQPFEELIGPNLPALVQIALLPFKDKIIYDGLMRSFNISFGPGIRRSLNERYGEAKTSHGIITSLPPQPKTPVAVVHKLPTSLPPKAKSKAQDADVANVILGMVEQFCQTHLNAEYGDLCRRLTEKLARKRPSPLLAGKPATWACGIVRTIGWINFLDDGEQRPTMKLTAIDKAFGVAESTGQGKSKLIRRLLKINISDHHWILPSRMASHSMIWMLNINGFMLDIRHAPREAQEIAFEKGLIPYIPADQD